MTEETLNTILAHRGYQRVQHPDGWLWVKPVGRTDGIPTRLCDWYPSLSEEGLYWRLDHYCELKPDYYTDEQRKNNKRGAIV